MEDCEKDEARRRLQAAVDSLGEFFTEIQILASVTDPDDGGTQWFERGRGSLLARAEHARLYAEDTHEIMLEQMRKEE